MKLKDRKGHTYCLGPTHEEVVTDLVHQHVNSFKQLPLKIYQISNNSLHILNLIEKHPNLETKCVHDLDL